MEDYSNAGWPCRVAVTEDAEEVKMGGGGDFYLLILSRQRFAPLPLHSFTSAFFGLPTK